MEIPRVTITDDDNIEINCCNLGQLDFLVGITMQSMDPGMRVTSSKSEEEESVENTGSL